MNFFKPLEELRKFVGPFSIVNDSIFFELFDSEKKFYLCKSRLTSFARNMINPQVFYCFGFSECKEEAELKSLGESLERYCGINYSIDHQEYKNINELEHPVVPPTECISYVEEQFNATGFPYKPFQETNKYHWIKAYECKSLQQHFIHSDLVTMQSEGNLTKASSIGMAVHSNQKIAIEAAIYECIERDHLALVFFSKLKCKRISFEILPEEYQDHLSSLSDNGYELYCLHIKLDIDVHVVLWLGFNEEKPPFFIKGAASHISLKIAAMKAFEELFRSFLYYKVFPFQVVKNTTGVFKNLMYYQEPNIKQKFDYLISNEFYDLENHKEPIKNSSIVDNLYAAGFKAYWVDMLPEDIKGNGLYCVRVIIPGLVKTPLGSEPWSLGLNRLFKFNKEIQYNILNIEPHFFS